MINCCIEFRAPTPSAYQALPARRRAIPRASACLYDKHTRPMTTDDAPRPSGDARRSGSSGQSGHKVREHNLDEEDANTVANASLWAAAALLPLTFPSAGCFVSSSLSGGTCSPSMPALNAIRPTHRTMQQPMKLRMPVASL